MPVQTQAEYNAFKRWPGLWSNKTASFNAAARNGYRVGVLAANCTATLPAAPATDDIIVIVGPLDATTFTFTVDGNGKNIDGDPTLLFGDAEQRWLSYDGTQWRVVV